jgi:two-component system, LytTR family, sensor kinase
VDETADCLLVKNNLQPKLQVEHSTQVGLKNIAQRYELTTGKRIDIVKNEFYFLVSLPLIHQPS